MKKYTVCIIPANGTSLRQFTVSPVWLRVAGFMVFLAMAALGGGGAYVYYKYRNFNGVEQKAQALEQTVSVQGVEIQAQKMRLKGMAERVNELTGSFVKLQEFEQKIRVMADLEQPGENGGMLAVGGSPPEALDASLPLKDAQAALNREMNERISTLANAAALQEDSMESLLKGLEGKKDVLACTPSIRPVRGKYWETSRFGPRKSPYTGLREFHKGLDLAGRHGTTIISSAKGTVTFAGDKSYYGLTIVIDHGHGMVTQYSHLSRCLKKKGDTIKRGEAIALMGNTGRSTGPHLHYEVHLHSLPVNPEKYILN
jgi:murein DD-endopeptidase MepM/ murein hydrolase activator NlpD